MQRTIEIVRSGHPLQLGWNIPEFIAVTNLINAYAAKHIAYLASRYETLRKPLN